MVGRLENMRGEEGVGVGRGQGEGVGQTAPHVLKHDISGEEIFKMRVLGEGDEGRGVEGDGMGWERWERGGGRAQRRG